MRFRPLQFLQEAPLVGYDYIAPADHEPAFARPGTVRSAQSPVAQEKVYKAFDKLPYDFHIVFLNRLDVAAGDSHIRPREDLPPWGTNIMRQPQYHDGYMGEIQGIAGIYPEPGVIKFVINSDDGDNYVPFTPWMIAHRFAHALIGTNKSYEMNQLDKRMEEVTEYIHAMMDSFIGASSVIHAIAPFASGREGRIGNFGEFQMECFAAWMIRGKIAFLPCPEQVPAALYTRVRDLVPAARPKSYSVDRSGRNYVDTAFAEIARAMNIIFKEIMNKAVGRLWIV